MKPAKIFLWVTILVCSGEANAQRTNQEKSGNREHGRDDILGKLTTRRTASEGGDLAGDNLDRVAATAGQILEILSSDAGLMVEFKRMMAEDASAGGQILEEADFSDKEKGLRVLLNAWGKLRKPVPLRIAGEGPLSDEIAGEIQDRQLKNVEMLGRLSRSEITSLMQGARFLVLPSICYENFPLTAAEAFASGLSVIASRLGAMAEIIEDGATGMHFCPGDPEDLARRVEWAWAHPHEWCEMGRTARTEYEKKYTGRRNYERTMEIYAQAVKRSGARRNRAIREQAVHRERD